ncbi:hypothetical protein ABW19_dt0209125 [Dactylella cylindrospora]|nr:hypothetical protein ABW19_dt0209125 [Dactylella cylindrospora]
MIKGGCCEPRVDFFFFLIVKGAKGATEVWFVCINECGLKTSRRFIKNNAGRNRRGKDRCYVYERGVKKRKKEGRKGKNMRKEGAGEPKTLILKRAGKHGPIETRWA